MTSRRTAGDGLDHKAPDVRPDLNREIDPTYDPGQDGSVPLETISVRKDEERRIWPVVWAVTTIVMVLLTLYLIFG